MGGLGTLTLPWAQPHMRMPMEPRAPHTHWQLGAGGRSHVRLPEPHRVTGGDTRGLGSPELGLAVAGAVGGSAGWPSWDGTARVRGQSGVPGEKGRSGAGHCQPLLNLQTLPGPMECLSEAG